MGCGGGGKGKDEVEREDDEGCFALYLGWGLQITRYWDLKRG